MFQTSPASAGMGKLGLEPTGGNQGYSTDSNGAFSQEFDKQVKNISDKKGPVDAAAPAKAGSESAHPDKATANSTDEQTPEGTYSLKTAEDEQAGGKNLPHSLAAEQTLAELEGESVREGEELAAEPVEPELAALPVREETELVEAELAAPQQPAAANPLASAVHEALVGEAEPEMEADEELSPLRLRDVLTQRFAKLQAESGAQSGASKEGKFDLQALLSAAPLQTGATAANDGGNGAIAPLAAATGVTPGSASSVPLTLALATPLQQKGWDQALGERVVWLARSNIQEAQIQLNPRELGPIEIKIAVKQDQAHVQFVAHHATTREALEAAMPRLRDMLNESGLNLAQSDVSQHSFREGERYASSGANGSGAGLTEGGVEAGDAADGGTLSHLSQVGPRGIDYFA